MIELFDGTRVVAPDLGEIAASYSTTEIERAIRHGVKPDGQIPGLAIAQAYSREDFETLMRTGEALGGCELGLMTGVARSRFTHFTDDEITALHGYLNSPETWSD